MPSRPDFLFFSVWVLSIELKSECLPCKRAAMLASMSRPLDSAVQETEPLPLVRGSCEDVTEMEIAMDIIHCEQMGKYK